MTQTSDNTLPPPSALRVMFAGLCSLILTMGVARFSYTPILPVMMEQTFLDESSGGWLATINYLGYMCGAMIAALISDLKLKDTLYRWGLVIAVASTLGMVMAENYWLWSVMRFMAGLSSAAGLLLGSGLILNWLLRHHYKAEMGIHFAGVGLGIATTALLSIWMAGKFNWSGEWLVLTVFGIILLIPSWFWLPRPGKSSQTLSGQQLVDNPPPRWQMNMIYAAYFCAGFAYVISATFLVAIVEKEPSLAGNGNLVWLLAGVAAAPACILWDRLARRTGVLVALILAYLGNILSLLLPVIATNLSGVVASGLLFGGTFIGIVSLMLTMVGKFYPTKPARPMARLTLSYGVAQIIGPAMTGMMVGYYDSYRFPLLLGAGVATAGVALLWRLHATRSMRESGL